MSKKSKQQTIDEGGIELGQRYQDEISGWEGIAVSKHQYLHGCLRVGIEAMVEGKPEEYVFDAPRLVRVIDEAKVTSERTGGPGNEPSRLRKGEVR